jgi:hypothetical protein
MVPAPCGPDPEPYIKAIRAYQEVGFDEIYLGQSAADSMAPSISLPAQVRAT